MTRGLNALMSWVVVFMDLVDLDPKQIESPLPWGKDRIHHA
jgi:hypothetical protein